MLNVKNADMADFEQIMKIYKYAQDYMIKSGNPAQWGHFYPDAELIKSDICQNLKVQNLLISILRMGIG